MYRSLTITEVEQSATVLSQAFVEDPLCAFILPREKTRVKTLRKFFRLMGEVSILNHCCFGVGEPLQGVAYWQFPGQSDLSVSIKSLGKLIPLLLTHYPIGLYKARHVIRQTEAMHQEHTGQPHFYLDNLGVLPSARGQGLSSQLIRPFLEIADDQKVMAYTDTVTRANVSLYEHFGFECIDERSVPGTGITIWALRRPAAS